jgi:hypothetical protein
MTQKGIWYLVEYYVTKNDGMFDQRVGGLHKVPVELPPTLDHTDSDMVLLALIEDIQGHAPYYGRLELTINVSAFRVIDSPNEVEE